MPFELCFNQMTWRDQGHLVWQQEDKFSFVICCCCWEASELWALCTQHQHQLEDLLVTSPSQSAPLDQEVMMSREREEKCVCKGERERERDAICPKTPLAILKWNSSSWLWPLAPVVNHRIIEVNSLIWPFEASAWLLLQPFLLNCKNIPLEYSYLQLQKGCNVRQCMKSTPQPENITWREGTKL